MLMLMTMPKPTWLVVMDYASIGTVFAAILASLMLLVRRHVRKRYSSGQLKLPDNPVQGLHTRKGLLHA